MTKHHPLREKRKSAPNQEDTDELRSALFRFDRSRVKYPVKLRAVWQNRDRVRLCTLCSTEQQSVSCRLACGTRILDPGLRKPIPTIIQDTPTLRLQKTHVLTLAGPLRLT